MSNLLPVDEAIARVLAGVEPTAAETVPLAEAFGRVLAEPLAALRTQPPFAVSAMDGYAVRAADLGATDFGTAGTRLAVIGSAPAGHRFTGSIGAGEAVRIFTGAPMPPGADAVLIQENTVDHGDGMISTSATLKPGQFARPRGLDFTEGDALIAAGTRLGMRELALAAAMNHASVAVRLCPRIAVIATGDELVSPGQPLRDDQIVASTFYGLDGLVRSLGGVPVDYGIIADDRQALGRAIDRALADGADVLVTLGGASVGDHDIVGEVLAGRGMALDFWKIAMRPGKPLMFGRIGPARVIGLPGNPVSSLVCAVLFLAPLIRALLGAAMRDSRETARLGKPLKANDRRQDYLRAVLEEHADGSRVAKALPVQDSSMLSTFAQANCLIIRPPHAPAADAGDSCQILRLP